MVLSRIARLVGLTTDQLVGRFPNHMKGNGSKLDESQQLSIFVHGACRSAARVRGPEGAAPIKISAPVLRLYIRVEGAHKNSRPRRWSSRRPYGYLTRGGPTMIKGLNGRQRLLLFHETQHLQLVAWRGMSAPPVSKLPSC